MRYVSTTIAGLANPETLFDVVSGIEGTVYRQVESRRTFRFEHGGKDYFAKVHTGVGWREIFKNLSQLRVPILDASNEWRAIRALERLGVDTLEVVGYSAVGANPATRKSCIITVALEDTISLEDLARAGPVEPGLKRRLIARVADIARIMHTNGLNHRDLYVCHFHLDRSTISDPVPRLHVIDLHRAQLRQKTPRRWIVKDVSGLFFSVFDAGLTRRDVFRFMRAYSGKTLRATLLQDVTFWREVVERARRQYLSENEAIPAAILAILA